MADVQIADAQDPRTQPHTEVMIRHKASGKIKRTSSVAVPRYLNQGWEVVDDATQGGRPLGRVPGLPDAVAVDPAPAPAAPASTRKAGD